MATMKLLNTLFDIFESELSDKYEAQGVPEVDLLLTNRRSYHQFVNESSFNTKENRNDFHDYFKKINSVQEIPETMKVVTAFISALERESEQTFKFATLFDIFFREASR